MDATSVCTGYVPLLDSVHNQGTIERTLAPHAFDARFNSDAVLGYNGDDCARARHPTRPSETNGVTAIGLVELMRKLST